MGWATIIAVISVVFVVTFSNLRGMALRENESHAEALLRALGEVLSSEVLAAEAAPSLREWTDERTELRGELTDARWLEGDVLLRHGYLVEWRFGSAGPVLVAWPTERGLSGNRAFTWSPDDGLEVRANEDEAWSGLDQRPGASLSAAQ